MSGKRPTDHMEPSAKKRGNDRQLTKDDESEEEEQAVDPGNFSRASEEVLKQRKIIKARRGGEAGGATGKANPFAGIQLAATAAAPAGSAANPFAGVSLFGSAGATAPAPEAASAEAAAPPAAAQAAQEGAANADKRQAGEQPAADPKPADDKPAPAGGGFGGLGAASGGGLAFGSGSVFGSASGGFGSLAGASGGTGFSFGAAASAPPSSSIFSFSTAAAPSFGLAAGSSAAAGSAAASDAPAAAAGAGSSLFGATPASGTPIFGTGAAPAAKVELPEGQAVTTGEEDEHTVFSGEGALFEFDASKQWRERGRGEMRVNIAKSGQARLVMRQKGNLRLLMNANLWAEMQVSKMEGGKGVTFACVNAAVAGEEAGGGKEGDAEPAEAAAGEAPSKLATFALRIKAPEVLDDFMAAVNVHKAAAAKKADEAAADP